jgi:small conductance mechanosensitive channel
MGNWQELLLTYGLHAGQAALALVIGGLAIWFVSGPLRRILARSQIDPTAASFLVNTGRGVLLVAVILIALDQLGVQTTSLIALLGAAGLAIGLALQGSLANFASSLLLVSFRTIRVGDWIEVGALRGQVREMHPFHVVLVAEDNRVVTVPNTLLTGGPVANDSALPTRRVRWTLTCGARADLEAARQALTARLRAEPRVLAEPAPQVVVEDWAADHRQLAAMAWTASADRAAVQRELLEELGKSLDAAGPASHEPRP